MTLDYLWERVKQQGYAGVQESETPEPADALALFYLALIAFHYDDLERAAAYSQAAARSAPDHPVFVEGAVYLDRVLKQGKTAVYVDGDAFAAFIRGGGNVALYQSINQALRAVYDEYQALTVLDIGVGDGLALLPALSPAITYLDLIEPSRPMLDRVVFQLREQNIPHRAHNATLQACMRRVTGRWDVIQATWSLQSIPPETRPAVFEWLHAHGNRVIIAEFDVPAFDEMLAPDRVQYIVDRYANGLQEYNEDRALVAQGFLMPVMFGYFDRSAARTNWEGPITEWCSGLRAAGFTRVAWRKLMAYFWADSYVIDAR